MKLHLQLIPILLLVRSVASISDSVSVAASIQQAKNKIFGDGSPTFKGFMREMDTLRPGYATNCANDFGEVIIAPKDTKTIRALAVPRRLSYLCGHSVRISSTQFVDSNYPDQLQSTWAIVWDVCEECSLFGNSANVRGSRMVLADLGFPVDYDTGIDVYWGLHENTPPSTAPAPRKPSTRKTAAERHRTSNPNYYLSSA